MKSTTNTIWMNLARRKPEERQSSLPFMGPKSHKNHKRVFFGRETDEQCGFTNQHGHSVPIMPVLLFFRLIEEALKSLNPSALDTTVRRDLERSPSLIKNPSIWSIRYKQTCKHKRLKHLKYFPKHEKPSNGQLFLFSTWNRLLL